jgi:hypothetical protein
MVISVFLHSSNKLVKDRCATHFAEKSTWGNFWIRSNPHDTRM